MKASERTVYKCDYCGKNYLVGSACGRHETFCPKNPANRHACFDCAFLTVGMQKADDGYNEKTFHCDKLDLDLHSFKAERIGHSCLEYTGRMPLTCPDYKYQYE